MPICSGTEFKRRLALAASCGWYPLETGRQMLAVRNGGRASGFFPVALSICKEPPSMSTLQTDCSILGEKSSRDMRDRSDACPICGKTAFKVVLAVKPHRIEATDAFAVGRCQGCGTLQLHPKPDPTRLGEYYRLLHLRDGDLRREEISSSGRAKRMWRWWTEYPVAACVRSGPVLDLGCNGGELLAVLRRRGCEVHGVDSNPAAVDECHRKEIGADLSSLEDYEIPRGVYKCIVLSHVIEHLADPVELLIRVRKALAKDGRAVICLPNCRSPFRYLFGRHWHGWDPPFHMIHYDSRSLKAVLSAAGFVVARKRTHVMPDDFGRSLAIRCGSSKRRLLLRAALLPGCALLTLLGFGSYLLVEAAPVSDADWNPSPVTKQ